MFKRYVALGSIVMLLAVAIGAFGAHALKPTLAEYLPTYETGVHYHMVHGLALIFVALIADRIGESNMLRWAGRLLFLGIIIFSGSLYILSITKVTILGAITPIGGVCFLSGWALLAASVYRSKR